MENIERHSVSIILASLCIPRLASWSVDDTATKPELLPKLCNRKIKDIVIIIKIHMAH